MKIFTKIALIVAGAFAGIGVVCLLIASAMGLTKENFMRMVEDGRFQISFGGDNHIELFDDVEIHFSDDAYEHSVGTEEDTVEIEEKYTKLDLEYGAGKLEIYYDAVEQIQVYHKNVVDFRAYGDEDTLCIEGGIGVNESNDAALTIVLPENYILEEADLEIGAAHANIEGLTGSDLQITVGAGEANLVNLNAQTLELEVGAGEANVIDVFADKMDIEAGVGQVNVRVSGAETYYNYNVECGIGSVKIGENSYGGLGAEQKVMYPGAEGVIHVECGIGEVVITFAETHHDETNTHHSEERTHHSMNNHHR